MPTRTSRMNANRIVDVIKRVIDKNTRDMAMVETTWGTVASVDIGAGEVSVFIYGSTDVASDGFRIIGGGFPEEGDVVKVAIHRKTGDRWIMEPIHAAATDSVVTDHGSLTGLSDDDHPQYTTAIEAGTIADAALATHTGDTSDAHDASAVSILDSGNYFTSTDVEAALQEIGAGGIVGGGVTDHGDLTGLADDDHPQYATNVEFDDHSSRHESGGADAMTIDAAVGTGSLRTLGTGSSQAAAGDHGHSTTSSVTFVVDGAGSVISTGLKGGVVVGFACTITAWTILSTDGTSGAIVVDIWKDSYSNFPPTVADTITGSEKPTITATGNKGQDTSLNSGSGWSVAAGDILYFNVDSVTSLKRVAISLKATRTV